VSQQLLLIGGGHAHLGVLDAFARKPPRDTEVTLVSRFDRAFYSGMLPGWLAGHYRPDECQIPLADVAARARAAFVINHVVAIDLVERVAYTEAGTPLPFDFVSIDIGPQIDPDAIRGLGKHAVGIRPIETFVERWQRIEARYTDALQAGTLTIVGGGPAGAEIALAIGQRVQQSTLRLNVQLITGRPGLLPSLPKGARQRIARLMPKLGVRLIEDEVVSIGDDRVQLARVGDLRSDVAVAAIGTGAANWPRECGLKCDERGFILVNSSLQSVSHPFVFAAGDCASIIDRPRPKSGVYAVRAGLPLAANLRNAIAGKRLRRYRPQPIALYLLAAGVGNAVGTWGPFSFEGERIWRWKDRIDRRFVARFNPDAAQPGRRTGPPLSGGQSRRTGPTGSR
jgi:selenide,water dikinase